ncbi:MAG: dTDP-4-dehydrorhamnose reductase [Chloroflexi bacterium]|nr:dTDP-4-dehydrorhamnose reductase [Chloroflexota bacterium]
MRVLVTGCTGQLGHALVEALHRHQCVGLDRAGLDIADRPRVAAALAEVQPDVVINAAAYTDVDGCERDPERAYRINAVGPQLLALACREVGAALAQISTDYVFDGLNDEPYWEFDEPHPLNVYGRSKLAGERYVQTLHQRHYIVRTAWLYGDPGRNFVKTILRAARERPELQVVDDERGSPTAARDLAIAVARLIESEAYGLYHLVNDGVASRWELARRVVERAGLQADVQRISSREYRAARPAMAARPACSALRNFSAASILGIRLRPWAEAVDEFVDWLLEAGDGGTPSPLPPLPVGEGPGVRTPRRRGDGATGRTEDGAGRE